MKLILNGGDHRLAGYVSGDVDQAAWPWEADSASEIVFYCAPRDLQAPALAELMRVAKDGCAVRLVDPYPAATPWAPSAVHRAALTSETEASDLVAVYADGAVSLDVAKA